MCNWIPVTTLCHTGGSLGLRVICMILMDERKLTESQRLIDSLRQLEAAIQAEEFSDLGQ